MARILVQTDDGKTTLVDELHVTPVRLSSRTESMNLLERLRWGVLDAERRHGGPPPRRPPVVREGAPPRLPGMLAVMPGVGRSFD